MEKNYRFYGKREVDFNVKTANRKTMLQVKLW